jgi:hypothetical protein
MNNPLPPLVPSEDFWSRRANAQIHTFACAPYGIQASIMANQPHALEAARLSAGRYSTASDSGSQPIRIQLAIGPTAGAPVPDDLPEHLTYTGFDEWIMLSAGKWGHGFANLHTRTACIALSQELASDTRWVSRYFIDHYVTNLVYTEWAMLHASCVFDAEQRRLIILIATHNSGKSTTALRLMQAGYLFLADGITLLKTQNTGLAVGGYPIGEVKLRDDVLAWFPEYAGEVVRVREHTKTIVDLRSAHPDRIAESVVTPESIHLCFVERHSASETATRPIGVAEAGSLIAANTVYWHEPAYLAHNTAIVHRLLRTACLHRLRLGSHPDQLIDAFNRLAN